MTPKFLREEAARFRDMAGTADREASKQRLLAMAADYEVQANTADGLTKPKDGEMVKGRAGGNIGDEPKKAV